MPSGSFLTGSEVSTAMVVKAKTSLTASRKLAKGLVISKIVRIEIYRFRYLEERIILSVLL